jgi:AcrR family transcriptional regulator
MLYKHFPSKEALFSAVIEEKISRFRIKEFLESLDRDQPFGEILSKIAMHILSAGRKDPEANNLLLYSSLRGTPEAKKLFMAWRQPYVDFLEDIMTERIEKGTLRKLEPSIVACSFVGMVIDCSASCFLWREFGYDEFDPEKAVYNNVKIFTQGLELCSQEGGTDETS